MEEEDLTKQNEDRVDLALGRSPEGQRAGWESPAPGLTGQTAFVKH